MDDELFSLLFEAQDNSPLMREIWQQAYGDDYPEHADPLSFVTQSDLSRLEQVLGLEAGDRLVDLGCGAAGPSATVAMHLGAQLTGIDASPAAIRIASERHLSKLPEGSQFINRGFDATGLADSLADGVMSTDALLFSEDFDATFREAARICRPGGRLVFTSFELSEPSVSLGGAGPIEDYRPHLENAGFTIETYEETPDWESRMRAVFSGLLDHHEALVKELGEQAGQVTMLWATLRPQELPNSRRVFCCARR